MKNKLYSGILMVTGSFPPDITGGGIQCSNLLKNLPVGLRNYFCITTTRDKNLPVKQIEDWGIVYRVFINPQSKISKIKSFFEIIRIFLGIKNKIKIIHLHSFTSKSVLFVLLASIFKKKIILKLTSMGDDDPFSIKKRGFGNILYRFYKCADVFISVSPGLTEVFKRSELRD
ncbi:MAG: hypothetical protein NT094_02825, partial [Candidatus Staskawiczbacteria bacterium]|nr:hypothetical protein [Candidatus Staskawiczbacteria bacterium]